MIPLPISGGAGNAASARNAIGSPVPQFPPAAALKPFAGSSSGESHHSDALPVRSKTPQSDSSIGKLRTRSGFAIARA